MVSALIPSKRVEEGIHAVAKIKDAHLVVAGDGPLRSSIETKAQEYLPGRFTLLSVPAHRMPDVYRAANVFLHMSKSESFGNVYLEAMATGLPIVAQDSEHVRWVVGDNEFLVDTQDAESVSRAISCAAQYGTSDKARRVRRAQTFAWPIVASRYRTFFKKLASNI
jgi:glycosyltransferase involved in cell wall biosynthesis